MTAKDTTLAWLYKWPTQMQSFQQRWQIIFMYFNGMFFTAWLSHRCLEIRVSDFYTRHEGNISLTLSEYHPISTAAGRHHPVKMPGKMHRLAAGAIANLAPAGGAIGNDRIVGIRLAHRRQQAGFRHTDRHIIGVAPIAKGAGHAAAGCLDGLDLGTGQIAEHRFGWLDQIKRLLMTMTVQLH